MLSGECKAPSQDGPAVGCVCVANKIENSRAEKFEIKTANCELCYLRSLTGAVLIMAAIPYGRMR